MTSIRSRRDDADQGTDHYEALNAAYPRSWWIVAYSSDVPAGRVVPARLFERDVVLWRDDHGEVRAMAAHCPHLGANLGVGGEVVEGRVKCPFHGWQFDRTGALCAKPAPEPMRRNLRSATYRVIERYEAVYIWNGAGEPDIEFPDLLGDLGVDERDVVLCHHRWLLPFPVKMFAENVADGMHFAVTHDTGGWGETRIREQSSTLLRFDHVFHDPRPWWSWTNLRRRAAKGELTNMFTAANADLSISSWGATLHTTQLSGRPGVFGRAVFCWTPVEADSHYFFEMLLMPRLRVPVLGTIAQRVLDKTIAWTTWTTVRQDVPVMMRRNEGAKPPYAVGDRSLVAFRRLWDSRIASDGPLDGPDVRHNGLRAGIGAARGGDAEERPGEMSAHAARPDRTENVS